MRISDWSSDVCSSDLLVPFAVFGAWESGFIAIAVYSAVTFFIAQGFFFSTMRSYALEHLPPVAENFRKSRYAFMTNQERSVNSKACTGLTSGAWTSVHGHNGSNRRCRQLCQFARSGRRALFQ